jgi:hypothetical protein
MAIFKMLIVLLAVTSTALADSSGGALTPIDQDPCLMMPEITKPEVAVAGTHYIATYDMDCDDSFQPMTCNEWLKMNVVYRYYEVVTTDYYNSDGKIVVSKTKKKPGTILRTDYEMAKQGQWENLTLSSGLTPIDDAAKEQMARQYEKASAIVIEEIRSKLTGEIEACSNSFYK